jgi:hypothetical protein
MNKLTTHKGDTLLLIEVPKDAYDFKIKHKKLNYREIDFACDFDIELPKNNYEIIGTTSTLTDEQVNDLIKDFTYTKGMSGDIWFKCDTLNEFLEANNIDTSKEYVILKLLNNE